jgi:5-methylthioadenosine/S-adenosylhomocysteine deaminase
MDEAAIIAEADKVGRRVWDTVLSAGPVPIPGRPVQR